MHDATLSFESPQWSGQVERRLRVSLLLSSACIAAMLLVLRFPVAEQAGPVTELFVRILMDEVEPAEIEPVEHVPIQDEPLEETAVDEPPRIAVPAAALPEPTDSRQPTDWYALIPESAKAAADRAAKVVSVNPAFDERRRLAAIKFAPSKAPQVTPIWENVEKDTMGRTILRSGDCYRVINDPNAGSREAFETFGQYIAMCSKASEAPRELPWVSEIRSRRASRVRSLPPAAE